MYINETEYGFEVDSAEYFFFFGKSPAHPEVLQQTYPQYLFTSLKQTHGNQIVQRSSPSTEKPEADGHWTQEKSLALLVNTADCIPVLMVSPSRKLVMALHAGWRGVANRIIPKGFETLKSQGVRDEEIFAMIGPHIQQSSFEVSIDVKDQLLQSVNTLDEESLKYIVRDGTQPGKYFLDLNALAKIQMAEFSLPADQIFDLHLDTYTDQRFYSYRRQKETAGRQSHFVVRK